MELDAVKALFSFARERESIRLKKERAECPPWTDDPVLQRWRFCNVDREDDRTTRWYARHIRDLLVREGVQDNHLLFATVGFRLFNSVEIGRRILPALLESGWDGPEITHRLRNVRPVTGSAYIVPTFPGMSKLDGICEIMDRVTERTWFTDWNTLREAHADLMQVPYLGPFIAYEIVTDLRHTPILWGADDIDTWASVGPGAAKGLECLTGEVFRYCSEPDQARMLKIMAKILEHSRDDKCFWPGNWKRWEMRTVEHVLCEFAKYAKAKVGVPLKRRYVCT